MKKFLPYFFLLIFYNSNFALKKPKDKEDLKNLEAAESYYKDRSFLTAIPLYEALIQKYPTVPYYKFKAGICYLYKGDEKQKSLQYLEEVYKKKPKTEDVLLYLGRAYHLNERFDDAKLYLTNYLKKKPSKEKQEEVTNLLENCDNAKEIIQTPRKVKIYNIEEPVNSQNGEYVPVISSDESILIFTYRGERSKGGLQDAEGNPSAFGDYYEDVFISSKNEDDWNFPESIGDNINTTGHDAAIALSNDGQMLFVFKSTLEDGGDIYLSKLEGKTWTKPKKLKGEVNSSYWEGSASLSSDGKTLYFTSERPGGFGGRDIYKAQLSASGYWTNVVNLGDKVNTKRDEDAPFIHPDGKKLFFSSKGHKSIGGYDVYRSDMFEDGNWSLATNLGYPINTTQDDIYYVVSANGKRGYYSSTREGGKGDQDIFVIEPAMEEVKVALMQLTGIITLDDQPIGAGISIVNTDNQQPIGTFDANASTGKYLANIPLGTNYKITYKIEGQRDEQYRTINAVKSDSFTTMVMNVPIYTLAYLEKKKQDSIALANSNQLITNSLLANSDTSKSNAANSGVTAETKQQVSPSQTSNLSYQEIVDKYGTITSPNLSFKVQIAAFRMAENFKTSKLKALGKIESQSYGDGITRFTIGGTLKTLNKANQLLKKVNEAGIQDAFILCFYKGEKLPLRKIISDYSSELNIK